MKKLIISLFVSLFIVSGLGAEVFADDIYVDYVESIKRNNNTCIEKGGSACTITTGTGIKVVLTPAEDIPNNDPIKPPVDKAIADITSKPITTAVPYISEYCKDCWKLENLVISDVFDLSIKDSNDQYVDYDGAILEIPLTVNQIKYFVALLHYDYHINADTKEVEGTWEIIPETQYDIVYDTDNTAGVLKLRTKDFSPYAIVTSLVESTCGVSGTDDTPVSERGDYVAPKTGVIAAENDNNIWHLIAIAALAVTAVSSYIFVKKDNKK